MLEGISCFKGIAMRLMALPGVSTKLVDQVKVVIQVRTGDFSVAAQGRRMNFPVDLSWHFTAVLHEAM